VTSSSNLRAFLDFRRYCFLCSAIVIFYLSTSEFVSFVSQILFVNVILDSVFALHSIR
jgi:hypothetical protein